MVLNCSNSTIATNSCHYDASPSCSFDPSGFRIFEYCICLLGMSGNFLVILTVWTKHTLHNVVFEAVATLAVADFTFIIVLTVRMTLTSLLSCKYVAAFLNSYGHYLSSVLYITMFSTNCHVSAISVLRYVMLTHPLEALTWISPRAVFRTSAGIWVGGVLVGIAYIIYMTVVVNPEEWNKYSVHYYVAVWGLINFLPLIVTVMFHIAKIRAIRTKGMTQNAWRSEVMVRMSRVVTVIIVTSALFPMPLFILAALFVTRNMSELTYYYWNTLCGSFVVIGCNINPVIYSFMSQDFRSAIFYRSTQKRRSTTRSETYERSMDTISN